MSTPRTLELPDGVHAGTVRTDRLAACVYR